MGYCHDLLHRQLDSVSIDRDRADMGTWLDACAGFFDWVSPHLGRGWEEVSRACGSGRHVVQFL